MDNSKEDNSRFATFIFVFNKDYSKILLIKRNEEKRKKWGFDWGIIGGKGKDGEYSWDAAIREAREEIGINLKKENLQLLYPKEHLVEKEGKIVHIVHFIYSTSIDESSEISVNKESDEARWFPVNKLPDKMLDSKKSVIEAIKLSKK
jgi:8-oxo-dGTP pyrophosphatase MutT (NUDIX family)